MSFRDFILILVLSSIGVAFLTIKIFFSLRRRHLRRLFFHAHEAERKAAQFLEQNGYRVVGEQVEKDAFVQVNSRKVPYRVRADYLLRKGNKTYVAEVKTGNQATSILQPPTRRQLLEYYLVYRPRAVLLIDGEEGKIEEIVFPYRRNDLSGWGWSLFLFLLGFVVGQWIRGR
ncbi:MAG: hypothetical protein ACP5Q4_00605 [Candidatus Caldatribacteriaceae bacterium]